MKYQFQLNGTIDLEQLDPAPRPNPKPEPKDPDGPKGPVISTNGKTMSQLVEEVRLQAVGNDNLEEVILLDGMVTGGLLSESKRFEVPVRAINPGKVYHRGPLRIRSERNTLDGFRVVGAPQGGLQIKAPGNTIRNLKVDMIKGVSNYYVGVAIDGTKSYSPDRDTVIDGVQVDGWGRAKEEVIVRIGFPAKDEPGSRVRRCFIMKNCRIINGVNGGYNYPMQTFWPVETDNNHIDGWNGEGLQDKNTAGRSWHHHNVLSGNRHTGRGAMYDRSMAASGNRWGPGNLIIDCPLPFDHYGSSNLLVEGNIFDGFVWPGRFQLEGSCEDLQIRRNTILNQKRMLGHDPRGWLWGGGKGVPRGIVFQGNIWKELSSQFLNIDERFKDAWIELENYFWKTSPPEDFAGKHNCVSPRSWIPMEPVPDCVKDRHGNQVFALHDPIPRSNSGDYTIAEELKHLGIGAQWPWREVA